MSLQRPCLFGQYPQRKVSKTIAVTVVFNHTDTIARRPVFNNNEWLEQVSEPAVDPARDIVDPHHHLWPQPSMGYNIDELLSDTSDGHAVSQTVFMEGGAAHRKDGADFRRRVGEAAHGRAGVLTWASKRVGEPARRRGSGHCYW